MQTSAIIPAGIYYLKFTSWGTSATSSYTVTIVDQPNQLDVLNVAANKAITAAPSGGDIDPWMAASSTRGSCGPAGCFAVTGNGAVLDLKWVPSWLPESVLLHSPSLLPVQRRDSFVLCHRGHTLECPHSAHFCLNRFTSCRC